jgi:hypothetical protein
MPRLDGEELARRALVLQPDLTIIITTGNGTIQNAVRMLKEGVFDFITKPFSVDALIASIEGGVERSRSIAELNGVREVIEALMAAPGSRRTSTSGYLGRVADGRLSWPGPRVAPASRCGCWSARPWCTTWARSGSHEQILNKPGHLSPRKWSR